MNIQTKKLSNEGSASAEKAAIDKGLQSIKEGHFKSNEDVAAATRKKYPHLFKASGS